MRRRALQAHVGTLDASGLSVTFLFALFLFQASNGKKLLCGWSSGLRKVLRSVGNSKRLALQLADLAPNIKDSPTLTQLVHCPGQALTLLIELCQGPNLQNQAGASWPLVSGEVGIGNESAAVPLAAFCEGGWVVLGLQT